MGLPIGGGMPNDLASLAAAIVVLAATVLPGLGIAWGLGRRSGWDWSEILGASFAFCLGLVGAVALAAHYLGQSLDVVLVATVVAFAALTWLGLRSGREGERPAVAGGGFAVAGAAALVAILERPWFAWTADTYYHLAAVRSLLVTQRPMVTDPFYGTHLRALDPTSGVWHTVLALVAHGTGLDVAWLWPGAVAVGAAMTMLAFWVLCRAVSKSARAATLASVAYLVLGLYLDMRWFGFPNHMALALVFLGLTGVIWLLEKPSMPAAALVVSAGFSAISLHLAAAALMVAAAVWLGVLAVAVAAVERRRGVTRAWRSPLALAGTGAALAAVSLPVVLPKAAIVATSPLVTYRDDLLMRRALELPWGLKIAHPSMIAEGWGFLVAAAAVIAAAAAVPAFLEGDRRALAASAVASLPVMLLVDPPVSTRLLTESPYMTWRMAILLPFTLFVGIAWALGRAQRRDRWERPALAVVGIAIVWATWVSVGPFNLTFADPHRGPATNVFLSRGNDMRVRWGADTIGRFARVLGTGYPMVAGDPVTTYYLAGILPIRVVSVPDQHSTFAIEVVDGPQRRADMAKLLEAGVPEATRRAILRRRDADYVVVRADPSKYGRTLAELRAEPDLFTPVVDTPTLVLFRVKR